MDARIRDVIDESIKELNDIQSNVEERVGGPLVRVQENWCAIQGTLDRSGTNLTQEVNQLKNSVEEAQLQVCLGVMEAKIQREGWGSARTR